MAKYLSYLVALAALFAPPIAADVWDAQTANDDDVHSATNELLHGTIQNHDLGVRPGPVADQDWYLMPQTPAASYEVIVDGGSGDVRGVFHLDRVEFGTGTTTTLQQSTSALGISPGFSRVLRWANTTTTTVVNQAIGVFGALCGTGCGSDDVYTIRLRETTVRVPRFNTTGTQATILLTQNASEWAVNATFFYWTPSGALLHTRTAVLAPKQLNVLDLGSIPALAGQSGSIAVAHDGGYGALVIKAVALETATGFTFDTPGVYVPY
jgi:hypothetical protein